ncbi:hypothetical protein [Allorhodopirellula heiligendammensis]|nr:hypothetical protein [Allorhodopirellula heiligendammensis]
MMIRNAITVSRLTIATSMLAIAFAAGCDSSGRSTTSTFRYTFTTAAIGEPSSGYFVTMVRYDGVTPWLIVAEPLDLSKSGFTTSSSSTSDAVTIDGTEYAPSPDHTIIVIQDGERRQRAEVATDAHPTLQLLRTGFGDVSYTQMRSLLETQDGGEPSVATEAASNRD